MDHRVEKFMAVVESESFTKGAEKLNVSQPSLSMAIKKLEKELGAQLIIRGGNFFQVTEEGKLAYEYGAQARLQLKNLKAEINSEVTGQRLLRVGMIDSVAERLFNSSSVDIAGQLEARIDNSSRLLRAVRLDQLDMAFVTKPFGSLSDDYEQLSVGEEQFDAVCTPKLFRTVVERLKKECSVGDFLTYDQSSTTFQWINKYFSENDLTYTPKFFSTNPELMLQMALRSKGVALLPRSLAYNDLKAKKLVRLEELNFTRTIITVSLSGKFISEEMKKLVRATRLCLK